MINTDNCHFVIHRFKKKGTLHDKKTVHNYSRKSVLGLYFVLLIAIQSMSNLCVLGSWLRIDIRKKCAAFLLSCNVPFFENR